LATCLLQTVLEDGWKRVESAMQASQIASQVLKPMYLLATIRQRNRLAMNKELTLGAGIIVNRNDRHQPR